VCGFTPAQQSAQGAYTLPKETGWRVGSASWVTEGGHPQLRPLPTGQASGAAPVPLAGPSPTRVPSTAFAARLAARDSAFCTTSVRRLSEHWGVCAGAGLVLIPDGHREPGLPFASCALRPYTRS
jgi:hypothetical protein